LSKKLLWANFNWVADGERMNLLWKRRTRWKGRGNFDKKKKKYVTRMSERKSHGGDGDPNILESEGIIFLFWAEARKLEKGGAAWGPSTATSINKPCILSGNSWKEGKLTWGSHQSRKRRKEEECLDILGKVGRDQIREIVRRSKDRSGSGGTIEKGKEKKR